MPDTPIIFGATTPAAEEHRQAVLASEAAQAPATPSEEKEAEE